MLMGLIVGVSRNSHHHALTTQTEYANKYQVGMHMHLLEPPYQMECAQRRTGTSAVKHLHKLGVLGPHLTLGHGVWLTAQDIDLIAETGTLICHNASSNLRLQSGIAPLNYYVKGQLLAEEVL